MPVKQLKSTIVVLMMIIGMLLFISFGLSHQNEVFAASSENLYVSTNTLAMGSVTQPLIDPNQIGLILKDLSTKNLSWLIQPGWLHYVVYEHSPQIKASTSNQVANLLSENSIQESWYHVLDDQGDWLESLVIVNDDSGHELQRAITTADGKGGNLTLLREGLADLGNVPNKPNQSQYVRMNQSSVDDAINTLTSYSSKASLIEGWEDSLNNKAVFVLYSEFTSKNGIAIDGYSQPVIGSSVKYMFNDQNGQLVYFESKYKLENGGWVVSDSYQYLTYERLQNLPDSIAQEYHTSAQELTTLLEGGK